MIFLYIVCVSSFSSLVREIHPRQFIFVINKTQSCPLASLVGQKQNCPQGNKHSVAFFVRLSVHSSGIECVFFNEPRADYGRKWLGEQSKCSILVKKSINIPGCLKMSNSDASLSERTCYRCVHTTKLFLKMGVCTCS